MLNFFKTRDLKQKGLFILMALALLIPMMPKAGPECAGRQRPDRACQL